MLLSLSGFRLGPIFGKGKQKERSQSQSLSNNPWTMPEEKIPSRDWEAEFAKANDMLKDLAKNDDLNTLFSEAQSHLEDARRAHEFSFFRQVEHHLQKIQEIWKRMGPAFFLNELAKIGISKKEVKGSDIERVTLSDVLYKEELPSDVSLLALIAICRDIAKKFSCLRIVSEPALAKDDRSGKEILVPALKIDGRVYLLEARDGFSISMHPKAQRGFLTVKLRYHNYKDTPIYEFSKEDLRPFALGRAESEEHFVMPSIIEELCQENGQGVAADDYISAVLAASLGMKEIVQMHAESCLKAKIERLLNSQGLQGDFLSPFEQKKLIHQVRPFIPEIRRTDVILESEFLAWLSRINSSSVTSEFPDISLKPLESSLIYWAEVLETIIKTPYPAIEKDDVEESFHISLFLLLGPWIFKLSHQKLGEVKEKELVTAIRHNKRKEEKRKRRY